MNMRALAVLLFASLLSACSTQRESAGAGHAADIGTSVVGIAMGAAELNPLGPLTLGAKALAAHQISLAPSTEQPEMWRTFGAFGWGAAANNACIVAAIASGGLAAPACPAIGLAVGMSSWVASRDQAMLQTFDAICAQARSAKPDTVCMFNGDAR